MCRQVRVTGRKDIRASAEIKRMLTKPCKTTLTSTDVWRSGVTGRAMAIAYRVSTAFLKLPLMRSSAWGKAKRRMATKPWKYTEMRT